MPSSKGVVNNGPVGVLLPGSYLEKRDPKNPFLRGEGVFIVRSDVIPRPKVVWGSGECIRCGISARVMGILNNGQDVRSPEGLDSGGTVEAGSFPKTFLFGIFLVAIISRVK